MKAVLSQRWPRNAPYTRGCPENFRDSLTTPTATIPKIFQGLLFRSILWMFVQNLKSIAFFTRSLDNGGTWQPLDTPTLPFHQFFMGFYSDWPCKCTRQISIVRSFTHSRDNRGYPKNLDSPWIRPRSTPKFLTGFYSEWPCKYIPQIWSP